MDGQSCGAVTLVSDGWTNVGSEVTVSGDAHILSIVIISSGSDDAGTTFGVDGVKVLPISGPGATGECLASIPSSSVSSNLPTIPSEAPVTTAPVRIRII